MERLTKVRADELEDDPLALRNRGFSDRSPAYTELAAGNAGAEICVTQASDGTNVVNQKLSAHPVTPAIRDAKQADTRWRHSVESGPRTTGNIGRDTGQHKGKQAQASEKHACKVELEPCLSLWNDAHVQ